MTGGRYDGPVRRHKALIGYLTYRLARRLVARQVSRALHRRVELAEGALTRDGTGRAEGVMSWLSNGSIDSGQTVAERVTAVRPLVLAAARDPELQLSVSRAALAGRSAIDSLRGQSPRDALRLLANDGSLQSRIGEVLQEADSAIDRLVVAAQPRRRKRRTLMWIAIGGLAALAGVMLAKRMRQTEPEIVEVFTEPEPAEPVEG